MNREFVGSSILEVAAGRERCVHLSIPRTEVCLNSVTFQSVAMH